MTSDARDEQETLHSWFVVGLRLLYGLASLIMLYLFVTKAMEYWSVLA